MELVSIILIVVGVTSSLTILILLFKIFTRKREPTHDEQLLMMYEKGQYLRPDENIDNKKLISELSLPKTENKEIQKDKPKEEIIIDNKMQVFFDYGN